MGRSLLKESLELWVLALGTHSRLLLIATGRWGAGTVTPGSNDPLRDGVGTGRGGDVPSLGRCGFILGRLYPQAGRGVRNVLEAGAPGRLRAHPVRRLIPGGWLSLAGTPTFSQPCLQAALLTSTAPPPPPPPLEETGALGAPPGQAGVRREPQHQAP